MADNSVEWLGDRQPSESEIERAQEPAEPILQQEFKRALLASRKIPHKPPKAAVVVDDALLQSADAADDTNDNFISQSGFTYPLTYLLNLPEQLPVETVEYYKNAFLPLSQQHKYIREVVNPADFEVIANPYMTSALACLGLCLSQGSLPSQFVTAPSTAHDLFNTARIVLSVIMECDNRESRKIDCIVAGLLMVNYGFLSSEDQALIESATFMGYLGLIVRRMHLTNRWTYTDTYIIRSPGTNFRVLNLSSLMSWMLLLDVVGALHLNTSSQLRTNELFFRLPHSPHNVGEIYIQLVIEGQPLPSNILADEDALLILLAICSDVIATQRLFEESSPRTSEHGDQNNTTGKGQAHYQMPTHLLPFSPDAERERVLSKLQNALRRWEEKFGSTVEKSVRALYHFVVICSVWSPSLALPHLTGYPPACTFLSPIQGRTLADIGAPSQEALRHAWLVLDNVDVHSLESPSACPIWLPVATHMASLVLWRSLSSPRQQAENGAIGSLKVLTMFKTELEQMIWPCSAQMARHLEGLILS